MSSLHDSQEKQPPSTHSTGGRIEPDPAWMLWSRKKSHMPKRIKLQVFNLLIIFSFSEVVPVANSTGKNIWVNQACIMQPFKQH